jgi:methylaspartate ammonia-lyase
MKIIDVICSEGRTGFYFDDQRAIKKGAKLDGAHYVGTPMTPGFSSVRVPGESISVGLVLEDGQIGYGDCAAVQYSGAGGRDSLFLASEFIPVIQSQVVPAIKGREIDRFQDIAFLVDSLTDEITQQKIHTAIRYGVTQALLDAVAKSKNKMMAEVIAEEYQTTLSKSRIPIFTQSGDQRYENADKMIIKSADIVPHGLINHVQEKLGVEGEKLKDYVAWLRQRVLDIRKDEAYEPIFHIDVYGTLGIAFDNNYHKMVEYLAELSDIARPFRLRIESPMDMDERESQIQAMRTLTQKIDEKNIPIEIVADEWCNTLEDIKHFVDNRAGHMVQIKTPDLGGVNNLVEAVLYCKRKGVASYMGGTCNETDLSSKACVHIAMATSPTQILAKPGMGVDEGFLIVYNEMNRILKVLEYKNGKV